MTSFTAVYDRDENGYWLVELAEEPRCHTYARTLRLAKQRIREAALLWVPEGDDVEVIDEVHVPGEVGELWRAALVCRQQAETLSVLAIESTRQAAWALVEESHLSMRDAGELLELSHQRIQQLHDQVQAAEYRSAHAYAAEITSRLAPLYEQVAAIHRAKTARHPVHDLRARQNAETR
jgi:predicted RNase H-like HicB family nuclease